MAMFRLSFERYLLLIIASASQLVTWIPLAKTDWAEYKGVPCCVKECNIDACAPPVTGEKPIPCVGRAPVLY